MNAIDKSHNRPNNTIRPKAFCQSPFLKMMLGFKRFIYRRIELNDSRHRRASPAPQLNVDERLRAGRRVHALIRWRVQG